MRAAPSVGLHANGFAHVEVIGAPMGLRRKEGSEQRPGRSTGCSDGDVELDSESWRRLETPRARGRRWQIEVERPLRRCRRSSAQLPPRRLAPLPSHVFTRIAVPSLGYVADDKVTLMNPRNYRGALEKTDRPIL